MPHFPEWDTVFESCEDFDPKFVETEDGGKALIYTLTEDPDAETGMFVRIQSWDETGEHKDFNFLKGKKVSITIKVSDDFS